MLGDESVSHTIQMLRDGFRAAGHFGKSLFVLDRYFLTVPLLLEWKEESASRPGLLHIITRAKKNCTAYMQPGLYKGKGRHPLHGEAVHLQELFQAQAASFKTAELMMYGNRRKVRYLSRTYLWGQKLYLPLRFVLVEYEGKQVILVSTDISMNAEDIITAYSYRSKIESMFREFKHQFGNFCYHFWSSAVPKLDRYQKKDEPDPLGKVKQEPEKEKIIKTLTATEGHVLFAGIAMGIIQMLCLKYASDKRVLCCRYLRTPSKETASEAGMMEYLRRNFFRFMAVSGNLTITKIISDKQEPLKEEENDLLIS
ncbi:MAG: transposase [Lachnospiraceae bacterium]|nr:transposase [Lachnospiraceae bacterium]